MKREVNATDARQGVELKHVRWVLAISFAVSVIAIAIVAATVI